MSAAVQAAVTVATPLRGPANPEAFRTQVYGARWYHDPLPSCDIAPATLDKWPAITTVKRSWSKEFKKRHTDGNVYPLDPLRVATYVDENLPMLATMGSDERIPLIAGAAQRDLNKAASRGTDVHTLLEALCVGDTITADLCGPVYRAICERIVAELNPTILYAETVAISRSVGVAGTVDAFPEIGGLTYGIDWKSRGADSSHAAYETEAAQLGAYSLADYLVADIDGTATRVRVPDLDGLLVVSIKPDSYEVFPIDLDKAREAAQELIETWKHRRNGEKAGRAACGKPIHLTYVATDSTTKSPAPPDDRRDWLRQRVGDVVAAGHGPDLAAAWPPGVPTLKSEHAHTTAEIDAIAKACDDVEAAHRMAFPADNDPDIADEGRKATKKENEEIRAAVAALNPWQKVVVDHFATEATAAGRSISLSKRSSLRRIEIARLLVALSTDDIDDADELLMTFNGMAVDDASIGLIVGRLTIDQARAFRGLLEMTHQQTTESEQANDSHQRGQ